MSLEFRLCEHWSFYKKLLWYWEKIEYYHNLGYIKTRDFYKKAMLKDINVECDNCYE